MAYATYDDYREEFGDDDLPDDAEVKVGRALERASKLVDTYIRSSGVDVPMTDQAAIADVKGSVLDIARYTAWSDTDNENLRKRYEDAISFLEKIAQGKVHIVSEGKQSAGSKLSNIRLYRA